MYGFLITNQYQNTSSLVNESNKVQFFHKLLNEDEYRTSSYIELLSLIVTILLAVRVCQKRLLSLRRRSWIDTLPGPRTYPVVGGVLYFSGDLKQTFKILLNWSEKYGPIFRSEGLFNEPFVFLNNPEHVRAVLSSSHLGTVSKPRIPYQSVFGEFLKNGLLISEGEYWKSHRRILSRAFTYKAFSRYIATFNLHSKRLVSDLDKLFYDGSVNPKEISNVIHCYSLQMICESVMGLDFSDSKEAVVFYENFQKYKIISSERATYFWFLIDIFWKLHPISQEYSKIIDTLNSITKKIIENRIENNKNCEASKKLYSSDDTTECDIGTRPPLSMIDEMLASGMTKEEILVEANTVIVAGFESTSLTIHYLLFLLALHPEHQQACQEEIDNISNNPIMCNDGNFTLRAISEMKYLERCCFETMRLFPVIFLFQRKPDVPVKLDNHRELPKGVNVVIPVYTIQRNPEYFPEPEKFIPDRFLRENIEKRPPYSFIPFSAGIRSCIGYKFAMMEIKAVAAHILRYFHLSTIDKIDEVSNLPSIVMTPVRDYKFILRRRYT